MNDSIRSVTPLLVNKLNVMIILPTIKFHRNVIVLEFVEFINGRDYRIKKYAWGGADNHNKHIGQSNVDSTVNKNFQPVKIAHIARSKMRNNDKGGRITPLVKPKEGRTDAIKIPESLIVMVDIILFLPQYFNTDMWRPVLQCPCSRPIDFNNNRRVSFNS